MRVLFRLGADHTCDVWPRNGCTMKHPSNTGNADPEERRDHSKKMATNPIRLCWFHAVGEPITRSGQKFYRSGVDDSRQTPQ